MDKWLFDKYLEKSVKPLRCICGREHKNMSTTQNKYIGGFIKQNNLIIWCCSKRCADRSLDRVM